MGDELDVKVLSIAENGFILTVPITQPAVLTKVKSTASSVRQDVSTLIQGQLVQGMIKSLKNQCAFI